MSTEIDPAGSLYAVAGETSAPAVLPRFSLGRIGRRLAVLAVLYGLAKLVTLALAWLINDVLRLPIAPLQPERTVVFALSFAAFFLPLLYLACCAVARQWLGVDLPSLVLTMGATFFFAAWSEVAMNTAFNAVVGRPMWTYHIAPVLDGSTSQVGMVMWPTYGFFLYFVHEAMTQSRRLRFLDNDHTKAILIGADAMALEIAANGFSIIGFGSFFFFYHGPDLGHLTTIEIFVPYVVFGFGGLKLLGALANVRFKAVIGLAFWALGVVSVLWVL